MTSEEAPATPPRIIRRTHERVIRRWASELQITTADGLRHVSGVFRLASNRFRLAGWARELGAVDLTRPEDEPELITPVVAAAIKRLDFHKGNGFGDPIGAPSPPS
ncbi:hypothetical protein ACGFWI_33675 [Streptomyces sp. NPDC048434]|uniref:hypothetical protein n=1 Tax=Streptomyces sp. NPDC048434 TaxID=3365549 RepID=UPI00371BACC9